MAIIATSTGSTYEPTEAGTYAARCFSMVVLGTHTEEYLGVKKQLTKVRISWELPTELKVFKEGEKEKPQVIAKEFTLSMHEKSNLRKTLESWRGKGFTDAEAESFDITKLLGKPCMISIIHQTSKQGKNYAAVSGVTSVPKGMVVPDQINPMFELSFDSFDKAKFEALPDFIKEKIKTSLEYKNLIQPEVAEMQENTEDNNENKNINEEVDDMPF